jgi:TolB protein
VGADGRGPTPLAAAGPSAVNPARSPDGKHIAFARQDGTGSWRICVVAPTGGSARCRSNGGASDSYPTWSADGRRLAFVREGGLSTAVFVADAAGGAARRVSPPWMTALQPAWAPRGARLAFVGRH